MLKYILGGVALAVTGYGIKKYLDDECNCEKLENSVTNLIDKVETKTDSFFDYTNEKIDDLDVMLNGKKESSDEDELSEEVEDEKQNDDLIQDEKKHETKIWNKTSDWI